jgi:polyferredoxin
MGALQSFTNKLNVFEIRIDQEHCKKCRRCSKICPTFSLGDEDFLKGRARMSCMKCGKCVDACSQQAISFHIKGTPVAQNTRVSRLLFIYPAFLFLAVFAGDELQTGMMRLIKLLMTGSPLGI